MTFDDLAGTLWSFYAFMIAGAFRRWPIAFHRWPIAFHRWVAC
jgi:hypothetical protein